MGKLLALSANVRLDRKMIARYKHCTLFGLFVSNKEESFTLFTRVFVSGKPFQPSLMFASKAGVYPLLQSSLGRFRALPTKLDKLGKACQGQTL